MLAPLLLVFACPFANYMSCVIGTTCPPVALENYCYVLKEIPHVIPQQARQETR